MLIHRGLNLNLLWEETCSAHYCWYAPCLNIAGIFSKMHKDSLKVFYSGNNVHITVYALHSIWPNFGAKSKF